MATTYNCPRCGRVHLTEKGAAACCAKQRCPKCNGKGIIAQFLAPNMTCPTCKGSGVV